MGCNKAFAKLDDDTASEMVEAVHFLGSIFKPAFFPVFAVLDAQHMINARKKPFVVLQVNQGDDLIASKILLVLVLLPCLEPAFEEGLQGDSSFPDAQ
jgi:hypothetical protein